MSVELKLTAEKRIDQGKGASRRLRRAKKVPAILYGAGREPEAIQFDQDSVVRLLKEEAFYSQILTVEVAGKSQQAVLKDIQRHSWKPLVQHMDLLRVSADTALRTHVPLHFINEDVAVGVKQGGGVVHRDMIEVEITCLPKDLPEFIEVDVSSLDLGESLHLSDLKLPAGVIIPALAHGAEYDSAVIAIHAPRVSSEEEEVEEGEGEETIGEPPVE